MKKIENVAIVGGTHGNEVTGVYLVEKYRQYPELLTGFDFKCQLVTANQAAITANKRYIERDLNRSFKLKDLANSNLVSLEDQLAKQLNQQLGPKSNSKTDLIIDLHTSTAPMGMNLVLIQSDPFHLKLADYVQQRMDNVTISLESIEDHHFLMSIASKQILIEVGATPQGVLRQDIFEQTEQALQLILNYIQLHNQAKCPAPSNQIELYQYFDVCYMPQDAQGNIIGMVHKNIQDRDFQPLKTGEPIFKLFNGEEVFYQGEDCTISFINEAAYYDEKKAFSMARKVRFEI